MGIMTAIAAVGVGISAAGAKKNAKAAKKADKNNKAAVAASNSAEKARVQATREVIGVQRQQEALRNQLMNMEAESQQRRAIREGQITRAQAANIASQTGARFSSGFAGVTGAVSGQVGEQLRSIRTNQFAGNQMYDFNKRITDINYKAGDTISGLNLQAANFQSAANSARSQQALASSMMGFGSGLVSNSQQLGQTFTSLGSFGSNPWAATVSYGA